MEKQKWVWKLSIVIITIFLVLYTLWLLLPGADSGPEILTIETSIDSHEEYWVVTIEYMKRRGENVSLVPNDVTLVVSRSEPEYWYYRLNFTEIKDTWCDDYGIIWYDNDGDRMVSGGDIIVILKEGAEEGRLLPGDEIRIIPERRVGKSICISSILPNNGI